MMRGHLDQTLAEATAQLTGDYDASVAEYDHIATHILADGRHPRRRHHHPVPRQVRRLIAHPRVPGRSPLPAGHPSTSFTRR